MGGLWPQLTGSISQLTLTASAKGVGVPSLADEPVLLWGCLEGRRPVGEMGSPGLPSWTLLPGPEQAAGGPSEDPRLTLAIPNPENYLNTLWCHHSLPSVTALIALPSPRVGRK